METTVAGPVSTRKGLSADALKLIAIVAMFIDHAAWVFVPDYYSLPGVILHTIGRITGPTMFFFIAEGYHRTRNVNRYTLRLAIFAYISYLPFVFFRLGRWPASLADALELNVIYTLLLGLLALRVRHEVKPLALRIPLLAAILWLAQFGDWGFLAVLFILMFDVLRGNFKGQALGYCVIVLTQLMPTVASVSNALLLQGVSFADVTRQIAYIVVMCGLFIPIILLSFYRGEKGKLGRFGKWLFYIFYPLHLLVLAYIRWTV